VSSSYADLVVTREGPVATVTLSRPDALNALTPSMLEELVEVFASLAADPDLGVVVLTGEGRAFSAGVDLKALGDRSLAGGKVGDVLDLPARRLIELIGRMDAVVVAAVNGHCFTGALELALACDLMVVADEAKLGDTHAKWGLRPTWGMSQRLPRAVGPARARYLSYTAATFTGAQAAEWGMAVRSCPRAELDEVVAELARTLTGNSRAAVAACKDLHRASERGSLVEGLAYEAAAEYAIHDTEDRVAGFR
jgi:enoyl-CoA hydratase